MIDSIPTSASFSQMVENLVLTEKLTYIEAILHLCEENEFDPRDMNKLLSKSIKESLEVEAMQLNYLPKKNNLKKFLK